MYFSECYKEEEIDQTMNCSEDESVQLETGSHKN